MEWLNAINSESKTGFKQVMIYTNETQKESLVRFFDSIKFYGYAIAKNVESSWTFSERHRNTHAWPGADCIFYLTVEETQVEEMIKELKKYRMNYPKNVMFAIGIIPVERVIPDLYNY